MAYKDDDKTMAVIKFAEEHPEGKLKWCDIREWLQNEETIKTQPFAKRLIGIHEYQFSRPIVRNGKKREQECKLRFDEINEMRKEISKTPLPLLITIHPEKFFQLSYSQQMEAIREAQESYLTIQKSIMDSDQIVRSRQIEQKDYIKLQEKVNMLDEILKNTITRTKKQMDHMMKLLNEASVIRVLEQYEIPMDSINVVKVMDELNDCQIKIYKIQDELNTYRKSIEEEGGSVLKEQKGKVSYWDLKTEALFSE